jgi:5-methylcytosine-specific restriction endonuclease McrA
MARRGRPRQRRGEAWEKQRLRVLVRDDFHCQAEGCEETRLRQLHAHHIVPVAKGGSDDLPNLITLCVKHHAERHPHLRRLIARPEQELDGYPWKEL